MEIAAIGPIQALKEGWTLFRRYPVVLLVGFSLCLFSFVASAAIPYLNWAILACVVPAALGGLHTLLLNAGRDTNPQLTDLLSGFRQLKKWFPSAWAFIAVWLLFFISIELILLVVAIVIEDHVHPRVGLQPDLYLGLMFGLSLLLAHIFAFALFLGYAFALFVATDGTSTRRSLARSQELVKGRRLKLSGTTLPLCATCPGIFLAVAYIVEQTDANAFRWPGWAVFALGSTIATLLVLCCMTRIYLHLDATTPRQEHKQLTAPVTG